MYFSKVLTTIALAVSVATVVAVPNVNAKANAIAAQAKREADVADDILKRAGPCSQCGDVSNSTLTAPPPLVNVSRATITNLINQAYDPSSIAANNLSEILLRLQAAKEIAEYEKDALRAALHVHQKPRNRHEPPLDLQQRKAFHSGAVWWSPCKLREARFRQLVKEKEKEKELLDKIELKEAKENNRIYQLKIKEAARAAREEAKKVRDEAKAVKAAELDAKRRDRDAAKAIQQPQSGKRKASKPAAKQQPKKRRVGGAGGGTLAEVAAPAPPPTTTRRGRAVNTPAKYR
ncbi:hypothetical protein Ptr86124_000049 [Pyrenophora tritici-repentis]|uniref:TolA, Membrane protein involved in colicin uptake n=1 Tax=Pyrenophora tritici-repentis TaxID=45151 RepID=A0A922NPD0_9PLEO|nr:hypothetical protein Ptr86124_000049 [Pyrenophora tritici-repentis]